MGSELVKVELAEDELRLLIGYQCDILSDCCADIAVNQMIGIVVRLHMLVDHLRELAPKDNSSGPRLVQ